MPITLDPGIIGQSGANADLTYDAPMPAATPGSFILAFVSFRCASTSSPTIVAPAGWSLRGAPYLATGTDTTYNAVFSKVVSADEPASYTWERTITSTTGAGRIVVGYLPVRGASGFASPIWNTRASSSLTTTTASFTTPSADKALIWFAGDRAAATYTSATAPTNPLLQLAPPINTALSVFADPAPVATGTYTRTMTASATSSSGWSGIMSATVAPAATNIPPTVTAPADIEGAEPGKVYSLTFATSDPDGTVSTMAFSTPGLTNVTSSGYTVTFRVPPAINAATYTVTATATDNQGATGSASVTVSALPATLLRVKAGAYAAAYWERAKA